jgi:hypothetical protein
MRLRLALIMTVVLLLPCALFAKGGVYIDNMLVTNDGRNIFSDDFDSGTLRNWTGLVAATVPCDAKKTYCSMHLNMHTNTGTATALHEMPIEAPGVLEVRWRLWVAPADEQSRHKDTLLGLLVAVMCQQQKNWIAASTDLCTDTDKPSLSILVNNVEKTSGVKIPTSKWVEMALRFDPGSSTVSFLADGKVAVTAKYDPSQFTSVRQLRLECGYGDGAQRTR